jgi:WD40 repeat protein
VLLIVDWSPDGKHLASGGTDGNVMIWNMEEAGKAYLQVKAEVGQRIFSVKWSPDGSNVVVGGDGGFVKVMPFITGVAEMDDVLRSNLLPFTSTDFGTSDAIAIGLSAEATAGLRHD